uniref:ENTH domain-containing protein n=2 Tax=Phaeomonas parva TaxID=124430 RepID=A0A6U4ENN7_9STRA|mmetsp:Transcript_21798/g.66796  ORF Transcript_21798/g.66796 Transcript_21798/m.66796 type:complete len:534 (+) Transcript_21798:736-2337(+)
MGRGAAPYRDGGSKRSSRNYGGEERAVVSWGAPGRGRGRAPPTPTLREKAMEQMEAAREAGSSQFRLFYRMGKSLFSSSYEKLFLQATAPDDEPVAQDSMERLLESIAQFRTLGDTEDEDNPYRVTLRKLWSKMMEKDWRTVIKALFLLHRIVRDSHPRDGAIFDRHLRRMQREINPKAKPPRTYFNLAQIIDLAPESESFRNFVGAYAVFVLKRATTFAGRFDQVKALGPDDKESDVLATMRAARATLNYGLRCNLEPDLENYVTCTALEVLSRDLRDLWKGYCKGINCLMEDRRPSNLSPSMKKEKMKLLESFKEDRNNLKQFMRKTSRALAYYRLRVPADLETKVDMDALDARIAAIKTGKAAPPAGRAPPKAPPAPKAASAGRAPPAAKGKAAKKAAPAAALDDFEDEAVDEGYDAAAGADDDFYGDAEDDEVEAFDDVDEEDAYDDAGDEDAFDDAGLDEDDFDEGDDLAMDEAGDDLDGDVDEDDFYGEDSFDEDDMAEEDDEGSWDEADEEDEEDFYDDYEDDEDW